MPNSRQSTPLRKLNLGAGPRPMADAVNHDRIVHGPDIDIAWDLEKMPWPWDDGAWAEVVAYDVMEHLRLDVDVWLDECWRILEAGGVLRLRLPAFDNHLSYRDPTHQRVFHPESFHYWDPDQPLWRDFGRYYWDAGRWWRVTYVGRENADLRFDLVKR